MAYTLVYSKKSFKDIGKLDKLVKSKIKNDIELKLLQNPLKYSIKLKDFPIAGVRRLRVGNYRVIFTINGKRIELLRVGHRKEIYR